MAKAKNLVVSGDFLNYSVESIWGEISLTSFGSKSISINKQSIESIEILDSTKQRDTGSTIARGIVGGILLGPAGMIGGAILGKSAGIHLLSIIFKNGKRSLLEIDDKIYKEIIKKMY